MLLLILFHNSSNLSFWQNGKLKFATTKLFFSILRFSNSCFENLNLFRSSSDNFDVIIFSTSSLSIAITFQPFFIK